MRAHEFENRKFTIDPNYTTYYDEYDDEQSMNLVNISVPAFDSLWANDTGYYIGHGGDGSIKNRYPDFGKWLQQTNEPVIAPSVSIDNHGNVSFSNGRHRFAWFRDHGYKTIPLSMDDKSKKNAKKLGLIK
jgi:hypothetical protein